MGRTAAHDGETALDLPAFRFDYDAELARQIESIFQVSSRLNDSDYLNSFDSRRRHLRGDAIRVTEELLPHVADAFQDCMKVLGIAGQSGDLYIQQSAEYNASIVSDGVRFDVVVNSSLVRDFTPDELRFVFGHELGHLLYRHCDISVPALFQAHQDMPPEHALLLFRWSRSAEVSADRIGLLCAGSLNPAVSALFKTTSGLGDMSPKVVLNCFRSQYDELKEHIETVGGLHGWARTHPLAAIRFKALEMASLDVVALRVGAASFGWESFRKLDREIAATLGALESTAPPSRGLRSRQGQAALFTILLFVALKGGTLSWKNRWFLHDVHKAMDTRLPIESIIDSAVAEWKASDGAALRDLRQAGSVLDTADTSRVLRLCALMAAGAEDDATALHSAIQEVAGILETPVPELPASSRGANLSVADVHRVLGV